MPAKTATPTTPATPTTLTGKILLAAQMINGSMKNDSENAEKGYSYVSANQVIDICGGSLLENGVMLIPEIIGQEIRQTEYINRSGVKMSIFDAAVNFHMHLSDGQDEMIISWMGSGIDYSAPDKAFYKAVTSGHKYFLMKLLMVATGNTDSEHESNDTSLQPSGFTNTKAAPVVSGPVYTNEFSQSPAIQPPAVTTTGPGEVPLNYSKEYWRVTLDVFHWTKPQASQFLRDHRESYKDAWKDVSVMLENLEREKRADLILGTK